MMPEFGRDKFKCPHCYVVSQQAWFDADVASDVVNSIVTNLFYNYRSGVKDYQQNAIANFIKYFVVESDRNLHKYLPEGGSVSTCATCNDVAIWIEKEIVYPRQTNVDPPNSDLDQEIQDLYLEASRIVADSPRGATALLRLALQLLLKQLGKPGKNINDDIKDLVAEGLSPRIKQALDLLRVVGNNAVHPGQINLDDGREIANKLFHVLNFIANEMFAKPKELDLLYSDVAPENIKQHIEKRDKK